VVALATGRVTLRAGRPGGPEVAVKVYREREKLLQELKYSRLARDLGLPVPPEIRFDAGAPAVLVTGWVAGEPVDRYCAAARELGQLLVRYYVSIEPPATAAASWSREVRARAQAELRRAGDMGLVGRNVQRLVASSLDQLSDAVRHRPQVLIHGDLQPEHVLVRPSPLRIVAILDSADSAPADPLFEVARLSLLNPDLEQPFLSGLGVATDTNLMPGYRVLWSLMSATWLAEHGFADRAAETIGKLRTLVAG
jgi:Ser/Thr protein kinase RdoA (MazF antagonist)